MLISRCNEKLHLALGGTFAAVLLVLAAFLPSLAIAQTNTTTPTVINITDTAKMTSVRRLGVNLGTQNFYDSGQITRNLTFRNPGFEAETWQSILHCKAVSSTSCTDDNQYAVWAANFFAGATAEVLVGNNATASTATVTSSTAANVGAANGVTINFPSGAIAPHVGDYVEVKMSVPGNGTAGWWPSTSSGASITTETTDLSPNTPGKQALKLNAPAGQQAAVNGYFDGVPGRSFVQLNGSYTISFRAKGDGGSNQLAVSLMRVRASGDNSTFFNKTITLTNSWQDYSYTFEATDNGVPGTGGLSFQANGATVLLDDVALTAAAASDNPTIYRNEVVTALRALKPGVLRDMDSGINWGSSIDNMLAPDFARERTGYSPYSSEMDDMPMGLPDFLVLCQAVGAEPWYTMPTGMSTQEMSNLMDYLGGSTSTVYGAKRAAMGQTAPWTSVFPTIHLEFGNEVWNAANPGASISDAVSYGKRASVIFTAAKASPSYASKSFDFIIDGFEAVPYWTSQVLAASSNYDTVDAAPYLMYNLNSTATTEAIFGPLLAQPESITSVSTGLMAQNAATAAGAPHPAKLAIYETNLSTNQGSATQAVVNSMVPSIGAGLASTESMLLMMRDLGVNEQNLYSLTGLQAGFHGSNSSAATLTPLWGAVVDLGGQTNRLRPTFLTEQLANSAILPTLLSTSQTGNNPTWNQAYTTNDDFSFSGAHYIQSFAFTDGNKLNVILFNLSRTSALPVTFSGLNTPTGAATISTLTAPEITASNETGANVAITSTSATLVAGQSISLPPFSMTVISAAAPVIPIEITGITATCAKASLSPSQTISCSENVTGQGAFNPAVTWTATSGSITSAGAYTAPAAIPSSGNAIITATSVQDTTKSASFTLPIANNTITAVTAKCASNNIGQESSTTCSAAVTGTGGFNSGVVWTTSAGSIDANGNLTAPGTGTSVTVKATSAQDSTKFGTFTVTLFPVLVINAPVSAVTSTSATVGWQLNAVAHSGISYGTTPSVGTTTPYDGRLITTPSYTLNGLKSSTLYYMQLFSYNGPATTSKAYQVKTPPESKVNTVSITCAATSVPVNGKTSCTAALTGSGSFSQTVTWSASAGTIDSSGNFTAPSTGTSATIQATSTQDTTKFAVATILLTASTAPTSSIKSVSVSCASDAVAAGAKIACKATVAGTGTYSSAVNWAVSEGTVDAYGNVTAPANGTSITVKATSQQDKTKSGTATLTLTGELSIENPQPTVATTTAVVSWTNTIAAHSGIDYGTTPEYGSTTGYQSQEVTKPKISLTGLKPGTTYYLRLHSFIGDQNQIKTLTIKTNAN